MLSVVFAASLLASSVAAQASSPAVSSPAVASSSAAQSPATEAATATTEAFVPLASQHFNYNSLPYQADPTNGVRGPQYGYNICNSTTEGITSKCQTAMINSIDDFCLWGPPTLNAQIADTEGETVAWCTKPGRGTRLIPQNAIKGIQFMKTPDYVQVTGFIDQTKIYMTADDFGGEMDPHGADQRGNPIGGLLFSNAWSGDKTQFTQAVEWHNFMGAGMFCLKACDPAGPHPADYCEHVFDRIGCAYNAPSNTKENVFESCEGDSQDFPGVYTGSDGVVSTYTQPAESLGVITTIPYTARVPASSNCVSYTSSVLYAALPTAASNGTSSTASGSGMSTARASSTGSRASSASGSSASSTASSNAALGSRELTLGGSWMTLGAVVFGAFVGAIGVL